MANLSYSERLERWQRLVGQMSLDPALRQQFVQDPTAHLVREGLIMPGQAVTISARAVEEVAYDVLVYPASPASGEPETLTLPAAREVREYFEKLPKTSGTIIAGLCCAYPGGCSNI